MPGTGPGMTSARKILLSFRVLHSRFAISYPNGKWLHSLTLAKNLPNKRG
jgi:hypothetical protein